MRYISSNAFRIGVPRWIAPVATLVLITSNGVLQADETALATLPANIYRYAGVSDPELVKVRVRVDEVNLARVRIDGTSFRVKFRVRPDPIKIFNSSYMVNLTTAEGTFLANTTRRFA